MCSVHHLLCVSIGCQHFFARFVEGRWTTDKDERVVARLGESTATQHFDVDTTSCDVRGGDIFLDSGQSVGDFHVGSTLISIDLVKSFSNKNICLSLVRVDHVAVRDCLVLASVDGIHYTEQGRDSRASCEQANFLNLSVFSPQD